MNAENLSLIEQTIIKNKKRELYRALSDLAFLIREKQLEIMDLAGISTLDKGNIVKDCLIDVITEDTLPLIDDIVLPKETEKYFLEKGVNELLEK
ncbi:MFS transporter [Bacillus pseudomycoides]|uniref:MFS transporter n=1 Tax=Bacillus bingmayongensis TaxID=1150157 RepID=A0ABU5K1H6_9BACI|nr:MFS transporter [Bacillus pseudomycoides]